MKEWAHAMLRRQRTDTLLTVLLWLLFFIAMTMKQAYGISICSKELPRIVQKCIEEVRKMESFDCRLYTPTLDDYQKEGANCPDCEVHRERAAKDFLTTLLTILEWMNNKGCSH